MDRRKHWERTIGLRAVTIESLSTDGIDKTKKKLLKKDLGQMRAKRGKARRSMDCAVLYSKSNPNNGHWREHAADGTTSYYTVWQAAICRNGTLYYYPVTSSAIDRMKTYGIDFSDVTDGAQPSEISAQLQRFAEILDGAVFDNVALNSMSTVEKTRNPVLDFLAKEKDASVKQATHPRPECDPWVLLGDVRG